MKNLSTWLYKTILVATCLLLCGLLGYYIPRENTEALCCAYMGLGLANYLLYGQFREEMGYLCAIGVAERLCFGGAIPALSPDFYRFLWDGYWVIAGINPYTYTPFEISTHLTLSPYAQYLFEQMTELSRGNFSNYPPIHQLFFIGSAYFGGTSVLGGVTMLRIPIILADIAFYYFGKKLLIALKLPPQSIFLYFLHPLVIVELTGNLHFEGVMMAFWVASIWALWRKRHITSAILLAGAIATKLLLLLLLPFYLPYLGVRKSMQFYAVVAAVLCATSALFWQSGSGEHYLQTVALWFTAFEFNASFYYIFRAVGYLVKGYNIIGWLGKTTLVAVSILILYLAWMRPYQSFTSWLGGMLAALSLYFFTATTVHPWYVVSLLGISVFVPRCKFAVVWGLVVVWSYSAYKPGSIGENGWIISAEYALVYATLWVDMTRKV